MMGWKLGLKAFAVYRDGCKAASRSQRKERRRKPSLRLISESKEASSIQLRNTNLQSPGTRVLTYSIYEDGNLAEIFIRIAKRGSTLAGLLDTFAIAVSLALQHGVPLKMCHQFIHGLSRWVYGKPEHSVASSITDYIFKFLALRFLPKDDLVEFGLDVSNRIESHMPKLGAPVENGLVMETLVSNPVTAEAKLAGAEKKDNFSYSGVVCKLCGGMMIRTGTCLTCRQCGEANGGC